METEKDFIKNLDKLIDEYAYSPCQELLYEILTVVFAGITDNCAILCPVHLYEDNITCEPLFVHMKDGEEDLALLTQPDAVGHPTIANLKLQGLMYTLFQNEKCAGIVFNPFTDHQLFIPKTLFASAFSAAWKMGHEKECD